MNKKLFLLSIMSVILNAGLLNACQLTVVNDTNSAIKLEAREPMEGFDSEIIIQPGDAQKFGNPDVHANLTIYEESSAGNFEARKIITQHACSKEHAITLHAGELFNNVINLGLFNIEDVHQKVAEVELAD